MEAFEAEIKKEETGRLTYVKVPFDARACFSIPKGTIYVAGRINEVEYRGKLLSRGKGEYILVLCLYGFLMERLLEGGRL